MNKRKLTKIERSIIDKLLSIEFKGQKELAAQLKDCSATFTEDTDNYGSIYLHPMANSPAQVVLTVPVEGLVEDSDGESINILLHVKDGLMTELEIVKLDGSMLRSPINSEQIEVLVNQ